MSFQVKIKHTLVNYDDNVVDDAILVSPVIPVTLDLFHTQQSLSQLKFLERFPKSNKQKRSLDNQYCEETMNRKNEESKMPKLELKLNLSPPRSLGRPESPSSCVSSETSSAGTTSMVLVGCPRCLMYVMLPEDDPKCPKCKSTVLLDFLHNNHNNVDVDHDDKNNNSGKIGSSKRTKRN